MKFIAGKKCASFSTAQRDAAAYPVPYVVQERDVCSVISARIKAVPDGVFGLREAKKLLQCPPFVPVSS